MKTEEAGERIFDYFTTLPPGRSVTSPRACEAIGISRSQWTRGRRWLRELFGRDPIIRIYVGREQVYLLASYGTERDSREYVERLLRGRISATLVEYNEFSGIYEAYPTSENERQMLFAKMRLSQLRTAYRQLTGGGQDELFDDEAS